MPKASKDIVVPAPLSIVGSRARIGRLGRGSTGAAGVALRTLGWVLTLGAWVGVLLWYLCAIAFSAGALFGYRLLRRGQRRRKLEDARHRELLDSFGASKD